MTDVINLLNYEISNAEAGENTIPENYLISVDDDSESKTFNIPNALAKKYTIVQLGDQHNRR